MGQPTTLLRCSKPSMRIASSIFPAGITWCATRLTLRPDTVLIALHPTLTQIDLLDETPEYQGVGAPKAVLLRSARRKEHRQRNRSIRGRHQPACGSRAVEGGRAVAD